MLICPFLKSRRVARRPAGVVMAAAAALALAAFVPACRKPVADDPAMRSPEQLVAAARRAGVKRPYVNPGARPIVARTEPAWPGEPLNAPASALFEPGEWRRLDRRMRFDAVILAGALAEFEPLLRHLLDSPDWRLDYVDNWGYLFLRKPAGPYAPPPPDNAAAAVAGDANRARWLAQTAGFLDAANLPAAAAYMRAALDLAPANVEVLSRQAAIDLRHRRWHDALERCDRALERDRTNASVLEIKAQALFGAGNFEAAWAVAEELVRRSPSPSALLVHARLAHEVHAFSREQASLEKLLAQALKSGEPATSYRVYLGQCYAKQGLARLALEQFDAVLADPAVTGDQRRQFEEVVRTIRARSGIEKADNSGY